MCLDTKGNWPKDLQEPLTCSTSLFLASHVLPPSANGDPSNTPRDVPKCFEMAAGSSPTDFPSKLKSHCELEIITFKQTFCILFGSVNKSKSKLLAWANWKNCKRAIQLSSALFQFSSANIRPIRKSDSRSPVCYVHRWRAFYRTTWQNRNSNFRSARRIGN